MFQKKFCLYTLEGFLFQLVEQWMSEIILFTIQYLLNWKWIVTNSFNK